MDRHVMIGVDAHKRTHTLVVADEMGRALGEKTVPATRDGHRAAVAWATRWPARSWAIEDCRHLTRTLERDLLAAGETLLRVPTHLMAGARRSARVPGKSDPIDALAAARAAWREPGLPTAALDGPSREVRLLVDHREDLVVERTRLQCRVRWHLHELAPELEIRPRSLRTKAALARVWAAIDGVEGMVAMIAREILERIGVLNARVLELEREIKMLVARLAPSLLAIDGCGALTAAKIVGETAGITRFRSRSAYARWNGTAPQPAWSGNSTRVRLSRGGNRQVNAALHRIAITQARGPSLGREYVQRRVAAGNTRVEALRLLRRRLSDVIYRTMRSDSVYLSHSPGA